MREPKLEHLKVDEAGTAKLRATFARQKAVRITINIDPGSYRGLRRVARETGVPYETLISWLLRMDEDRRATMETRLNRLEQEVKRMKRIMVA
ncbi:hypothetical protein DNFV4_01783 [Nitrospira tepida]|uniref:Uncharacterized protein n=1 Tax=Nitrospira tepida TaxID=2973512 RepID=A0AA86MYP5_9BACT|nr:hypothetical protein [Nitrospira tepida]CAI4031361.1 hypothetical protein DNFV4_01783 [Nitrospira tepida]